MQTKTVAPEPKWIIRGLFPEASLSLIIGESGSMKTGSMLDAAVAIAMGDDWLEHETMAGPVLIIDGEDSHQRMSERIGKVLRGHGITEELPIYFHSWGDFDFSNLEEGLRALQTIISVNSIKFVLIDALADIMPGKNENAVKDVQAVLQGLRSVAENTRAALVMIHHTHKEYRGSSFIKSMMDLVMQVEKRPYTIKPDNSDMTFRPLTFKSEKTRDIPPFTFSGFYGWNDERFCMADENEENHQ